MSMREHLKAMHEQMATHHVAMAKTHRQIAKHFGKSEMVEGSEDLANSHEELAGHHADQAAYHISCCKTLDKMSKAAGMGMDRDELMPDGISVIIPEAPVSIRAVPRHGSPELGKAQVAPGLELVLGDE